MSAERIDPELVEQIVSEVIRRLMDRGVSMTQNGGPTNSNELVIDERVITLATLAGRLSKVGRVIVCNRAVVTPAVKDELKDQGIEMVRR